MEQPFRIEKRECFRVIGYKITTTNKKKQGTKDIPAMWIKFKEGQQQEKLMSLMNKEPYGILGINAYNTNETDAREFDYYIAVSTDLAGEDTMSSYIVPQATWAVFPCTIETMGKTEAMAIMKWLPKSKYKPLNKGYLTGKMKSGAPDIEYYGKDGEMEVWIAVKEK
ncbi:MAG: GyrI-like domain-containing protein [Beduini sp.]|uniref:GyrI-like domain-containing protein n=1 Tax=Beduini sp. TaxID=1922300 RepID=UPI0039A15628